MNLDVENLRRGMLKLSDDELLSVVTIRRAEYRQVAIDLASKELMRRNVPLPTIKYPSPDTALRQARPSQAVPKKKSNHRLGYWLILFAVLIILDEEFLKPLLHKNQTVSSVIEWLGMLNAIYYLYKLYKWYKSDD